MLSEGILVLRSGTPARQTADTGAWNRRKPRPCQGFVRAADEARTRDPQLGKLMLYQLSYRRRSDQDTAARGSAPRAAPNYHREAREALRRPDRRCRAGPR